MTGQERSSALVRWGAVCVDCGNADELALFYSKLLGWEIGARNTEDPDGDGEAGWVELRNPPGTMGLCFQGEDDYEPPVWPETAWATSEMIHFEMGVIRLGGGGLVGGRGRCDRCAVPGG